MDEIDLEVSRRLKMIANNISANLDQISDEPLGFALVIFGNGEANYISNCRRLEVKSALRELVNFLDDDNTEDIPLHKKN